jgi:hypothetical protein
MQFHPTRTRRAPGQLAGPAALFLIAGRAALVLIAGAVSVALTGCGPHAKPKPAAVQAGASGPSDSSNIGGAPTLEPSSSGNSGGGGQQSPKAGATTTKSSSPSDPGIVYFRIKQKPQCPRGTNKFPVAAVPLIIEWQVTGTDQVSLAVDGPGLYAKYGPQASETFTFSCGGAVNSTETHTYLLSFDHNGAHGAKTLSASAKINEIPNV